MELLKWQKSLVEDFKDLSVFEVIAIRGSGKGVGSLAWAIDNSDIAVLITEKTYSTRKSMKKQVELMSGDPSKVHIISNIKQLRGLPTHPKKKLKIVVDEYLQRPSITLKKLDKIIGHEDYKVLFIGSRTSEKDTFQIPFSKQLNVDITQMIAEETIDFDSLSKMFSSTNKEKFQIEFGTPFETN